MIPAHHRVWMVMVAIQCDNGCGDSASFHNNEVTDLAITSGTAGI